MSTLIHRKAIVGPDGKIEVEAAELQQGQHVAVTIQVVDDTQSSTSGQHIIDLVKDLPGHRLFKTAEEVDEYLRQERASWED